MGTVDGPVGRELGCGDWIWGQKFCEGTEAYWGALVLDCD